MQEIFLRPKFVVKGFKFVLVHALEVKPLQEHLVLSPEHDYVKWSYNVKVSYKAPHQKRQKSIYMAENRDLLNIYEVTDLSCGENLGVVRYHFGIWEILDNNNNYFSLSPAENIVNEIFFLKRIPHVLRDSHGNVAGEVKKISPFAMPLFYKYLIDFSSDNIGQLDRRLAMAALILFVFAHERVGWWRKLSYYIASKLGLKPKDKPFILKKKTIFHSKTKRSAVQL
jgi:hypothetical protein